MSVNGTLVLVWAGGEDQFCLSKVGNIMALEEKCNAGISEIAARVAAGLWRLNDVRETIRLALIGGGMKPEDAMKSVKNHVDGNPLRESALIAQAILFAVLVGVPDDPVGSESPKVEPEASPGSIETTGASVAPS